MIWLVQQIRTPRAVNDLKPACKYQQAGTAADQTWTRSTTGGTTGGTARGVKTFGVIRAREITISTAAKRNNKRYKT